MLFLIFVFLRFLLSIFVNILQLISGVDVNGALVYCKLLCNKLADRGHHVVLGARTGSWITRQPLKVPVYDSSLRRFPIDELKRFRDLIGEHQIDLIHSHMSRANHFGVCLNLMTKIPVIATAHSRQWQLHWRFNQHVIANSTATADYLRSVNGVSAEKLSTTHCFVDIEKFKNVEASFRSYYRVELHVQEDDFLVGVVGDVTERKGHEYLLRALPRLLAEMPRLKIAFIGRFNRRDRYTRRLRAIIKRDQTFRCVKWLGIRDNVHEYIRAFDVLCVPSIEEPLGMVAIEAQAAGIPVVASNTGGLAEIIQHGSNGLLFEPKDPAAIHSTLVHAYKNTEELGRMSAAGQRTVQHRFCPERLTNAIEDTYRRVLGRKLTLAKTETRRAG